MGPRLSSWSLSPVVRYSKMKIIAGTREEVSPSVEGTEGVKVDALFPSFSSLSLLLMWFHQGLRSRFDKRGHLYKSAGLQAILHAVSLRVLAQPSRLLHAYTTSTWIRAPVIALLEVGEGRAGEKSPSVVVFHLEVSYFTSAPFLLAQQPCSCV